MEPKKYTETEMQAAKLAGFKTKKPKKPKTKTANALKNYIVRYNVWVDKLKAKAKVGKVKLDEKKRLDALKAKIAAL